MNSLKCFSAISSDQKLSSMLGSHQKRGLDRVTQLSAAINIPDHTRTSPYSTSPAINCPPRLKAPVRSRYGLSQSLVVRTVGFGPTRALVVTGDREEVPTCYLESSDTTSDDEEIPSEVEQELDDRPGLTVVESWVESWADKRQPLPSNKLANKVAKQTLARLSSNHASSTRPKEHIRGHTSNAENVPWKPDHTAVGYFRGKADPDIYCNQGINHEEPTFQKIPTTSFDTSPPSSLLSEHFCRPSSRQLQQTPGGLSYSSINSTTATSFRPNSDNNEECNQSPFRPYSADSPEAIALLQEADARRNFAGKRNLWRLHAAMIGEPDIPIPERRPVQAPTAPSKGSPAPICSLPVHNPASSDVTQGRATVLPRHIIGRKARNGPAPQPRRRGAQRETYLPPLTSIQASPESPEEVEHNNNKHARMANPAYKRLFQGKKRAKETTISDSVGV